ncbi:hypothetical protein CANCADRAFT_45720 [Tortispora caseinolytica NRRL Y-17796]|uniref:Micro-fibrillar-associated protein 1 C-terminal domain-containing protein n=1 Tax=Tortispora caseinolytica NRRL Y-17796 TaxID=767744 RepID=A0A1E4TBY3_9ASCO|nr:hypothetical protein CANCADRAFT_45720 [Tortispora caseinolytica NRRL Y-17796]
MIGSRRRYWRGKAPDAEGSESDSDLSDRSPNESDLADDDATNASNEAEERSNENSEPVEQRNAPRELPSRELPSVDQEPELIIDQDQLTPAPTEQGVSRTVEISDLVDREDTIMLSKEIEPRSQTDETKSSDESDSSESSDNGLLSTVRPTFISKKHTTNLAKQSTTKKLTSLDMIESSKKRIMSRTEELNAFERLLAEVDDTDGVDPEAERLAWEKRELARVAREQEEANESARKSDENENKTAHESSANQRPRGRSIKAAFYQDDEVVKRNVSGLTEYEMLSRNAGHKALRVRYDVIGKGGQTRHVSAKDEDTAKDSLWEDRSNIIAKRTANKLGGLTDEVHKKKKTN